MIKKSAQEDESITWHGFGKRVLDTGNRRGRAILTLLTWKTQFFVQKAVLLKRKFVQHAGKGRLYTTPFSALPDM